jgi:hypothetical protein
MTVNDLDKIDVTAINRQSGDVTLAISDHLAWDENGGEHLLALQNKLNVYLEFIESGLVHTEIPRAVGNKIIIEVVGKFPLSEEAKKFYRLAGKVIEDLGYSLHFKQPQSGPSRSVGSEG